MLMVSIFILKYNLITTSERKVKRSLMKVSSTGTPPPEKRFLKNVARGDGLPEPDRTKYLRGILRGIKKGIRRNLGSDSKWKIFYWKKQNIKKEYVQEILQKKN